MEPCFIGGNGIRGTFVGGIFVGGALVGGRGVGGALVGGRGVSGAGPLSGVGAGRAPGIRTTSITYTKPFDASMLSSMFTSFTLDSVAIMVIATLAPFKVVYTLPFSRGSMSSDTMW